MFSLVHLIGKADKSTSCIFTLRHYCGRDYSKGLQNPDGQWSGAYTRKSDNRKSCCPTYAIRCDAENYRFTKAQKKSHRDPLFDPKDLASSMHKASFETSGDPGFFSEGREASIDTGRTNSARRRRWQALQHRMAKRAKDLGVPYEVVLGEYRLRRQRRLDRNKPKELEEYLDSLHGEANPAHTIDIRMHSCRNRSREFEASLDEEFRLYSDYQVVIHNDPPEKWTRDSFIAYLVDTPLVSANDAEAEANGAPQFGSYHQQYWLDGEKLIAVGVIDIVPEGLSSVYFFYDPAYAFLRLGTYSTLQEIAFIRHLHRTYGSVVPTYADFAYYYMGFYVHSCGKMAYKNNYSPSYLACPETYAWTPLEKCQRLLDRSKYARFADANVEKAPSVDVDEVVILLPLSISLTWILPKSQFTVEGNTIVTTVAAARLVLSEHKFTLVRDWANLVRSTSTMRIDFAH
ncbi:Arginyl-tRNA--protein transferase 1 [Taenia crassiceps]|uniref:arginyltransferase n=1 Tax=Taenia crassiceps TaxID=6207 RepID=A0ABR4QBH5_9CEST